MTDLNACPDCHRPAGPDTGDLPAAPPLGAVMSCGHCANLYRFDGSAWREPTEQQRAALLADDRVIAHMSFAQEVALARQRDAEAIASCVTPVLASLTPSTATIGNVSRLIAAALIERGFHTHPETEGPHAA